jgi:hypothetical protein
MIGYETREALQGSEAYDEQKDLQFHATPELYTPLLLRGRRGGVLPETIHAGVRLSGVAGEEDRSKCAEGEQGRRRRLLSS